MTIKTPHEAGLKGKPAQGFIQRLPLWVKPHIRALSNRGLFFYIGAVNREWIADLIRADMGWVTQSRFRLRLLAEGAELQFGKVVGLRLIEINKPIGFATYRLIENGTRWARMGSIAGPVGKLP